MEYSKIKSIELHNFMSIENAKLEFDESGILNLKGYNDSGKSAILRAVAVCLVDTYKKEQVKFIKHGQSYFRVVITFEDGVAILRDKYSNGQSLYEMYRDRKLVFSTKQGDKLTKISGVPRVIADYLGLCTTENGCLNYQTRLDKLFLVETTGSENYQELHSVLKTEELSRAVELINSDKNELSSTITEIERDLHVAESELASCCEIDQMLLFTLMERDKEYDKREESLKSLKEMEYINQELESLVDIPELETLNYSRLASLESIHLYMDSLLQLPMYPEINSISTRQMKEIEEIKGVLDILEGLGKQEVPTLASVADERLSDIEGIVSCMKDFAEQFNQTQKVEKDLQQVSTELNKIVSLAAEKGYYFEKCNNCGAYVEVKAN